MNTPTTAVLAGEVRAEMARQGVTAAKVSQATDISRASLSRKLNGRNEFTVAEMLRVTKFLGLTLSDLLQRAESVAA
jgi:transcriptional regulator with XRE-family HTH domain